ncbi:MAG TPA: sigma 54-interacting transcriptional regulator [Polyangiaceae bacterium]|nr:sigma 54-interacting transcriptional regulator [Polyangiaceae bacterium]
MQSLSDRFLVPMDLNDTRPDSRKDVAEDAPELSILWVHPRVSITPLDQSLVTLGRDAECAVRLLGERVSRMHAQIRRSGPLYILSDLGSTNGTSHNGRPADKVSLSDNDVVRVGDHVGVIVRSELARAAGPLFHEPLPGVVVGPRGRAGWARLEELARTDWPIVLEGATGTGKEVYAKALHALSGRSGDFVGLNCAALPESLAEAQLFGQAKGAFTGALRSTQGMFEAAHRGTLLLDEIVDLQPILQAKLLRALEESAVTRVGETAPRFVDFRLVAASQHPLLELVEAGRFRPDLLARLAGGTIRLTPLCERREEIPVLFNRLYIAAGGDPRAITAGFCEALCLEEWPLNTRQLAQVASQASLATIGGDKLNYADLDRLMQRVYGDTGMMRRATPPPPAPASAVPPPVPSSRARDLLGARRAAWFQRHKDELERLLLELRRNGGNVSAAAKSVGISRQRAGRLLSVRDTLLGSGQDTPAGVEQARVLNSTMKSAPFPSV